MQLELANEDSGCHHTVIQVIGIGGGGSNAVQRMIEHGLDGVQFVMANTDLQALEHFQSPRAQVFPLGEKITGGLGAGGDPEVGRAAAEEDLERIRELFEPAHLVFITAGMGGGTGTGAAPVIAKVAKELDKLCVAVVTTPFHFEGQRKYQLAMQGIEALRKEVDTLIVIPNQLLLQVLEPGTSVRQAFSNADEVLRMGVKGIADLITQPGDINVDFNDVCTVMRDGGEALMGIGIGSGEERALRAAIQALENPLLSGAQMQGATGLLVQITADENFSLDEYSQIMDQINGCVDTQNANVISGIAIDSQKKDEIKVTVIATGFPASSTPEIIANTQGRRTPETPRSTLQSPPQSPLENPLQNPLQNPLATPLQKVPPRSGESMLSKTGAVALRNRQHAGNLPSAAEAGQAAQMRRAVQQTPIRNASSQQVPSQQVPSQQVPREVYRLNDEDNRLAEEQAEQVSNTELQLLFSEGKPGRLTPSGSHFRQPHAEPQSPPGQSEDLYVPTLLRRKQRRR